MPVVDLIRGFDGKVIKSADMEHMIRGKSVAREIGSDALDLIISLGDELYERTPK
ncbi:hypothetical protein KA529_04445 [Candidatus Saccharibacteria bacterium]|nr:hypothetical protein [Candidatus Saccharibacteria bacterium]